MNGAGLIVAERNRQIEEKGYTLQHDDGHVGGWLAIEAAMLAVYHTDARVEHPDLETDEEDPWGLVTKHAGDTIRCLSIAGALLAAEIDRLQRTQPRSEREALISRLREMDGRVANDDRETVREAILALKDGKEADRG